MGNNVFKTISVAFVLCLVCSILVSGAAVGLKERQLINADLDMKKNVLSVAGLLEEDTDIDETFKQFDTILVDLETGELVDGMDAESFDQVEAQSDPSLSVSIPASEDIAGLVRRSKYAKVFIYKDEAGEPQIYIFHLTSKGLYSTMYGFVALESDLNTVVGFGYYSQGETPGLGGEVDNPRWKSLWVGKSVYDTDDAVALRLARGAAPRDSEFLVDGLSGATATTNGVTYSIQYFFSENIYGKFINKVKSGEVTI